MPAVTVLRRVRRRVQGTAGFEVLRGVLNGANLSEPQQHLAKLN